MGVEIGIMSPHPPLIIPEVGQGKERKIQKTIDSLKKAAQLVARTNPEAIVIISPHADMYKDYFHISPGSVAFGDFLQFGAGSVKFKVDYDSEFSEELSKLALKSHINVDTKLEINKNLDHATMVPLYFLKEAYKDRVFPKIIRLGLSGLSLMEHYRLGQLIRKISEKVNRRIAIVASGDLSHKLKEDGPYGFAQEGPIYDKLIMEIMGNGDFKELFNFSDDFCKKAAECGHRSFTILAGTFDGVSVKATALSYEGPFGVGYGVCTFLPQEKNDLRFFLGYSNDPYVTLAKNAIEKYIKEKEVIKIPENLPEQALKNQSGVFVSLKKNNDLRGCIGTFLPTTSSIAEEIIQNAISAATKDPRFMPIEPHELPDIIYSVDVLKTPQNIESESELDSKKYGIIVKKGARKGLLLPDLDGVNTVKEQISIAKRKAGILESELVKIQKFEVIRHK